MADTSEMQTKEEEIFGEDWLESYMTNTILDAKYDAVFIDQVVKEQSHLNAEQQKGLKELLNKYKKLFDGTLGVYPQKKFIEKLHLMINLSIHVHMQFRMYI